MMLRDAYYEHVVVYNAVKHVLTLHSLRNYAMVGNDFNFYMMLYYTF
jgi:hypothetical protein